MGSYLCIAGKPGGKMLLGEAWLVLRGSSAWGGGAVGEGSLSVVLH